MKRWSGWKSIWGVAIALMITEVALFIFNYHTPANELLGNLGWLILFAAAFLAVIPVFTFRKKGGVPEGESYINTTVIVDTGIYAVIRHPQYLSFILICLGIIMVAQKWLITTIGIPAAILIYIAIWQQDYFLIGKFGEDYKRYMEKVPRVNFLLGIIRLMQRRKKE
jgi:protein-S-isoprenylcysteine O-methyltransferase Ste14